MTTAFLNALTQVIASESLYGAKHPVSQRAMDAAFERLAALQQEGATRTITFLEGEVVADGVPIDALREWDWARRLAAAQVERIELDADATRDDLEWLVDELQHRLAGRASDSAEQRQLTVQRIRYGLVRVAAPSEVTPPDERLTERIIVADRMPIRNTSLSEETAAVEWLHEEALQRDRLPMVEVDAVVRSLAHAMHGERRLMLPLLELRAFDEYTTTHAVNVSMLSMGLAERLGLRADDVRMLGTAGLLHDLGKVRIPRDILTKPGRLTDEERAVIQRHPVEGARLVLERESGLELAAMVAYEHHVCLDGTGYPSFRFPRTCHYASRIVHVCDIYDALCTDRPYRAAWEPEKAIEYLEERAGVEVDGAIVRAFADMVRGADVHRSPIVR